jgi:O-methyltransferase
MNPISKHSPINCYIDLLVKTISNTIYQDPPSPAKKKRLFRTRIIPSFFDSKNRAEGRDWPMFAHSMAGQARLTSLAHMVERVVVDNIDGDLIETGVWRGGSSILMRAMLCYLGDTTRKVYVADSFEGLPPPNAKKYPWDKGDVHFKQTELAISQEQVAENFNRYGLRDNQVVFVKGFFKDTLPAFKNHKFAILRLDGDMYESTMDALTSLYNGLNVGGYCIIDDYGAIAACRAAVTDFRALKGITAPIETIDWTGVFWRKEP